MLTVHFLYGDSSIFYDISNVVENPLFVQTYLHEGYTFAALDETLQPATAVTGQT